MRRPFLASLDPYQGANRLLRESRDLATKAKAELREALVRLDPQPRVPLPRRAFGLQQPAPGTAAPITTDAERFVRNPVCDVDYDANLGITNMVGRAEVKRDFRELAKILDPRSWSCTGGVIKSAFLVDERENGEYVPKTDLDKVKQLGDPWKEEFLYEYACSEVASFENILFIKAFAVDAVKQLIRVDYQLHDCLICTFGMASAPGGLTVNQGYIEAKPLPKNPGWWTIEVMKTVKVRDLTPHDPGNRYDFGQWVNATIGAALSQWVRDTSILSPAF